jgi:hypothetical protein
VIAALLKFFNGFSKDKGKVFEEDDSMDEDELPL